MTEAADQGTEAWRLERSGCISASRFADAIDIPEGAGVPFKSGPRKGQPRPSSSAARDGYMRELAFERLAGVPVHEIGARALSHGKDMEPYYKEAYELETGFFVRSAGFVRHQDYPFLGCSADGRIDSEGGIEGKSPLSEAVHLQTIDEGFPEEHRPQVQGCMLCTGCQWWDFISFDARQAPGLRLYIERIYRDDAYINGILLPRLLQFETELRALVDRLMAISARKLRIAA